MKFSIYGSCVTRDIFSELILDNHVKQYQARCSLHSKVSSPLIDEKIPNLDNLDSDWQKRMVEYDIKKNGLILTDEDVLIVDFIDERFNVMRIGETLLTESKEFNDMNLSNILNCNQAFTRGSDQEFTLWKNACQKFKESLPTPSPKIIVHKAIFALNYLGENGLIDVPNIEFNLEMNRRLDTYYSIFIEIINPIAIIKVPAELVLAEPTHKWGLAPFHYIHEYYEEAWAQLSLIKL